MSRPSKQSSRGLDQAKIILSQTDDLILSLQSMVNKDNWPKTSKISGITTPTRQRLTKQGDTQPVLKTETYHPDSIISRSELCRKLSVAKTHTRRKF